MQKRKLGKSELFVSEVGLGTMSLGKDEKTAASIIDHAIENGINYLDTADIYDSGVNEELVGKAIKSKRQDIILATKVGNRLKKGENGWAWDPSKAYIKDAVKESLRRLQTDYIDLYQLHGGTIEDNIEETIEAFEELTKEGLIRYYGISSIRPNVIREYVKHSNIVSVMMQYNLLDRRPESVFPLLEKNSISVIARGPLAKGMLTNKKKIPSAVVENGYLSYSPKEIPEILSNLAVTEQNRSLEATAIQFDLYQKVVGAVIPGASSVEQIIHNAKTIDAPSLTLEEYTYLKSITKEEGYLQHT